MSIFPTVNGVEVLLPAPDGYVVDLENPQRNLNIAAYWAFGVGNFLALLLLGQRLYTKIFLSSGLQREDDEFAQGIEGVHGWELPITKYKTYLLLSWIGPWIFVLCGSFAKLSVLTVCFRLSPFGWFRTWTMIALGIVISHTLILVFCMIFSCIPVQKSWDLNFPQSEGSCINVVALYFATAIANIFTDVILLVIPIPLIMGLNMPKIQKIGVLIIFIFASATLVTSIVRCAYLPSLLGTADQTWEIAPASIWAIIEANLLIICTSTTTLRRFFYHMAPTLMGDRSGDDDGGGNSAPHAATPGRNMPGFDLSTFSQGGKSPRRRDKYRQFNDDEPELVSYDVGTQTYVEVGAPGGHERGDAGSELESRESSCGEGIMQTKTVTVSPL